MLDRLIQALEDPNKKMFVARILKMKPLIPSRLLGPLLHAAVMERDPSFNRFFVEPCVEELGANEVRRQLHEYLTTGTNPEKAGAARALYWARDGGPCDPDLEQQIRITTLTEFIHNNDLKVRQCLIPRLKLDPSAYPKKYHDQFVVAISIARSSEDEYIRHRVEIQLGAGGPYKPLPKQ